MVRCISIAVGAAILWLSAPGAGRAQEIVLSFDDGKLPSEHGWTFTGCWPCYYGSLFESQVASVANGVLRLDTTPFGGVWGGQTLAYWQRPLSIPGPSDYEYEIRMRAIAPDSKRTCWGGLLGASMAVQTEFYSDLSVMVPQLYVNGFAEEPCFLRDLDGSQFRTYKIVVRDTNQARVFVNGFELMAGTLRQNPWPTRQVYFGDGSTSGGNVTAEIDFLRFRVLLQLVTIDIKPGSYPNSINLGSNGSVPVAIFSTPTFDARTVIPASVTLAGASVKLRGNGTPMSSVQDVNGDGLPDLVVHVSTEALQLTASDAEAVLEGQTIDGRRIRGTDTIRVVP